MNKLFLNADEAIKDITDGSTLMLGGFGLCGIPENCISAIVKKGISGLTCISNNGIRGFAGKLYILVSWVGPKKSTTALIFTGEVYL